MHAMSRGTHSPPRWAARSVCASTVIRRLDADSDVSNVRGDAAAFEMGPSSAKNRWHVSRPRGCAPGLLAPACRLSGASARRRARDEGVARSWVTSLRRLPARVSRHVRFGASGGIAPNLRRLRSRPCACSSPFSRHFGVGWHFRHWILLSKMRRFGNKLPCSNTRVVVRVCTCPIVSSGSCSRAHGGAGAWCSSSSNQAR